MNVSECQVTVVGLGLIGGSIALGLMGKVGKVRGLDVSEDILEHARKRRMADELYLHPEDCLPHSDVVIVALYPRQVEAFLLQNREYLRPKTLVMDVSSIKERIVHAVQKILPPEIEFLGTHPMAGREGRGIERAREEMFLGSYYLLTPTEKNTPWAIKKATSLVELLGVLKVVTLTPKEHDALVSYTSQMPHVLASLLMNGFKDKSKYLVGGSFKDATRVATINEDLWVELFMQNKKYLLMEMDSFEDRWNDFKEALQKEDTAHLRRILQQAKMFKDKL